MTDVAIRVENLGKEYRIGTRRRGYKTLRESLVNTLTTPFQLLSRLTAHPPPSSEHFWALKDVSFEVQKGEVVGIVGRNGAGKSTLLKILSRITRPTQGHAEIHGRVGSLLEVGTGFHPELTGRENIYLNGAILGMRKEEIERKFDEIVAFAEVEKFIDTAVKHYSSGMHVRLAFSVAAHLEPEILVVDEVLAVGDTSFQKKCLGKMDTVAEGGRTILFVSHNMGAIERLSRRCLWMDYGGIRTDGPTRQVISSYQSEFLVASDMWRRPRSAKRDTEFTFLEISAGRSRGVVTSLFAGNDPIHIGIRYRINRPITSCQVAVRLHNCEGIAVLTTADSDSLETSAYPRDAGQYMTEFIVPPHFLAPGRYSLVVAAHLPGRNMYEFIEQALVFEVASEGSLTSLDGRLGVVAPLIPWSTTRVDSDL